MFEDVDIEHLVAPLNLLLFAERDFRQHCPSWDLRLGPCFNMDPDDTSCASLELELLERGKQSEEPAPERWLPELLGHLV
eukprot:1681829-Prymnesium_polylepis.1